MVISNNVHIADSFLKRLYGLIPFKRIDDDYCLVIPGCISVHSCFMSFDIDVVFTDSNMMVLDIITLKPWRFSKLYLNSEIVFEFSKGFTYGKISVGDIIELRDKN